MAEKKFLDKDGLTHYSSLIKSTFATKTELAALVDSTPETLATLQELASKLGDTSDLVASMTTALGKRYEKVDGTLDNVVVFGAEDTLSDSGKILGVNVPVPTDTTLFLKGDGTWDNPIASKTSLIVTDTITAGKVIQLSATYEAGKNEVTVYLDGVKCRKDETFIEVNNADGEPATAGDITRYIKFPDAIDASYEVEVVIG